MATEIHPQGPFTIVELTPRYCPATDALLGERARALPEYGALENVRWALARADRISAERGDEDTRFGVRDALGRPVLEAPRAEPAPAPVDFGDDWI